MNFSIFLMVKLFLKERKLKVSNGVTLNHARMPLLLMNQMCLKLNSTNTGRGDCVVVLCLFYNMTNLHGLTVLMAISLYYF